MTAFIRLPDGGVRIITDPDDLTSTDIPNKATMWVDVELPDAESLRALDDLFNLDGAAIDDSLHGEQRTRIDEYEDYIFLVLYGAIGAGTDTDFEPRKLSVFCGSRFLITVHQEPLHAITSLRDRCGRHGGQVLGEKVDHLLFTIMDAMVDNYLRLVARYEQRLEAAEDRSLRADVDEGILEELSTVRAELLDLRHMTIALRELLTPLAKGEFDYIAETLGQEFGHVADHLMQVTESIDALRDRLTGVRENYHTALTIRTNNALKILTLFATVLLPMTLIAGIYGMNLPLWPAPDNPATFRGVVIGMLAVGLGLMTYFRFKRWV